MANELSNPYEQARALLVAGLNTWERRLAEGFTTMRMNGEPGSSAVPRDLGIDVLCAVYGVLLLVKTSPSEGPLKVALDLAFDRLASHNSMRRRH